MTDTIIKGTGNSRSIRSVPNLAALAPTWGKALELLTSEDGLPIDLGKLNPLGVDVMGTPLDSEHLITMESGSYYGTNKRGPSNPVSLTFSSPPKLIIVYDTSGSYSDYRPGFGFINPFQKIGVAIHQSTGLRQWDYNTLYVTTEGTTIKWYTGINDDRYGGTQLNGYDTYYYHAFL